MNDIVVYTAITDGYDWLNPVPAIWQSEAQFVAFLGKAQPLSGWKIRRIYRRFRDPCRNAKIHKILSHVYFPDAEYSLWVDGSIRIKSTVALKKIINTLLDKHDLAVFKHRFRKCCYQEAVECLYMQRDPPELIERQMQNYFEEGYPLNNGLAECTVLLRRHTQKIAQFNEIWYQEIKSGSRRDQLSFNYAAYKAGIKYRHLPGTLSDNPHFAWLRHKGLRTSFAPHSIFSPKHPLTNNSRASDRKIDGVGM